MPKSEGYKPSQAMASNAARGLELREKWGRGGTAVGVARARDLKRRATLSRDTVARMHSFFSRHAVDKDSKAWKQGMPDGGPSAGKIAWLLWGGDSGRSWAAARMKEIRKQEEQIRKSSEVTVAKVNDELGLVFGYAIVCKKDGEAYYDLHGDHIPEDTMLEAAADFMERSRTALEMHKGEKKGTIVFAFPLTSEVAKSLDIEAPKTGLLIAMRPDSEEILAKFRSGEYTGFSIGGVNLG